MPEPKRRIGFIQTDREEVEPMKQINTAQEEEQEPQEAPPELDGIYYDLNGGVFSPDEIRSKTKLNKSKSRNEILTGVSRLIFYTALATAILGLSYGVYQKYLKTKPSIECQKTK